MQVWVGFLVHWLSWLFYSPERFRGACGRSRSSNLINALASARGQLRLADGRDASRKIESGVTRTRNIPSFMMKPGMTSGRSRSTAASPARATSMRRRKRT
jgi:hypothetical protein